MSRGRRRRRLAVARLLLPIARLLLPIAGLLLAVARLLLPIAGLLLAVAGLAINRISVLIVTGWLPGWVLGALVALARDGDRPEYTEGEGQAQAGGECHRCSPLLAKRRRAEPPEA